LLTPSKIELTDQIIKLLDEVHAHSYTFTQKQKTNSPKTISESTDNKKEIIQKKPFETGKENEQISPRLSFKKELSEQTSNDEGKCLEGEQKEFQGN